MSLRILSSTNQLAKVQRAFNSQGIRAMTILSKESGEEYKKMVRIHI